MHETFFENDPDDLNFWRLCDELSIYEAALLVAGFSPGEFPYVESRDLDKRPKGYEAAKAAIRNALRGGRIKGAIESEVDHDINGNPYPIQNTVALTSRLEVESLKNWLASRGLRRGFFFPEQSETADYLRPRNSRYAPKLAAAVRAWQAVTDPAGKTPKQALSKLGVCVDTPVDCELQTEETT